jgi:hypothetical protein
MKMRTLVFIGVFAAFATPALAGHCPVDVRAIDAALANNPTLSATELALVVALRDQGNALHPGDHGGSLALLHQAMEILGIEHG